MRTFVLVWVYGSKATPIMQGTAQLCQKKRIELKGQPQYKQGKLILRTLEGFKANPLYTGKKMKTTKK